MNLQLDKLSGATYRIAERGRNRSKIARNEPSLDAAGTAASLEDHCRRSFGKRGAEAALRGWGRKG
jgi:hypothetical protein